MRLRKTRLFVSFAVTMRIFNVALHVMDLDSLSPDFLAHPMSRFAIVKMEPDLISFCSLTKRIKRSYLNETSCTKFLKLKRRYFMKNSLMPEVSGGLRKF